MIYRQNPPFLGDLGVPPLAGFIKQKEHLQGQMFFLLIIYVFLHQMRTFSFHSFLIPILFLQQHLISLGQTLWYIWK